MAESVLVWVRGSALGKGQEWGVEKAKATVKEWVWVMDLVLVFCLELVWALD